MPDNRSQIWIDAGGLATTVLVRTLTGGSTIQVDMQNLSNADILNWWESAVTVNPSPSPVAATYAAINQVAVLNFKAVDGTIAALRIPAPKLSMFLSDGVSVDPAAIATLIADCLSNLAAPSGSPAASFAAGFLRRPP